MTKERLPSIWEQTATPATFQPLQQDVKVDVAIVGGGITGLTAALQLKRQGRTVALLEAQHVGAGTSGRTTAHATAENDHGYAVLEEAYGAEAARLVRESMTEAIDLIDGFVHELGIECDLRRVPGYYYTESAADEATVRREFEAARRAGLAVQMVDKVPLPFPTRLGYEVKDQARFHALRYLNGLARAVDGEGCRIYDRTRVVDFEDGRPCRVKTDRGYVVTASDLILATHIPLGVSALQTALPPYRSFVITVRTPEMPADALFWDTSDPYFYVRLVDTPTGPLVMIGGKDRKTAHGDERESFAELEAWARERFAVEEIVDRWSAQFYDPADHLPSIGKSPLSAHVYVGTGYSGDGITFGTIAGHILCEQVMGHETAYDKLFRPTRLHLEGLKSFLKDNFDVAKQFVGDRLRTESKSEVADLAPGTGCVVKAGGRQLAAFRTEAGELRTFSAVCPHMRCLVHWNGAEGTFDCPCHGSRFDASGQVLEGPALQGLTPVDVGDELEQLIAARRDSEAWRTPPPDLGQGAGSPPPV